jgi:hypothetical protein
MNKGRVGEERKGKETDRCPLTDMKLSEVGDSLFFRLEMGGGIQ